MLNFKSPFYIYLIHCVHKSCCNLIGVCLDVFCTPSNTHPFFLMQLNRIWKMTDIFLYCTIAFISGVSQNKRRMVLPTEFVCVCSKHYCKLLPYRIRVHVTFVKNFTAKRRHWITISATIFIAQRIASKTISAKTNLWAKSSLRKHFMQHATEVLNPSSEIEGLHVTRAKTST